MDSGTDPGLLDSVDTGYVKTFIIVIVIVAIIYWLLTDCDDDKEHYIVYSYPKYCSSCGEKSRYRCNKCVNCGYCYTPNGYGECVPGDSNGPFFREDCLYYEYNAPGYKVNKVYPYMYMQDYPNWKRDKYYYDVRGYPKSIYKRYVGYHPRARKDYRHWKRHNRYHNHPHRKSGSASTRSVSSSGSRSGSWSGSMGRSGSRGGSGSRAGSRGGSGSRAGSRGGSGSRAGSRGGRR